MHTLGTTADLLESETLEVRSINSVLPSALRVVPTCTKIGEPLQMQVIQARPPALGDGE